MDIKTKTKTKVTLTLNKPGYLGMCILDLRKVLMYEFHYDYTKNEYGNNLRVLFTDADNVMYEIKTKNFMKISERIKKCLILAMIHISPNVMVTQTISCR